MLEDQICGPQQCCITMFDIENYEITSQHGKELLKQIEDEISRIKPRNQDSYGNREYELSELLDEKVRALLVNLQLSVREGVISIIPAT